MISFLCSHCGAQLRARPELAGSRSPCPRCGKTVEAPQDGQGHDSSGARRAASRPSPPPGPGRTPPPAGSRGFEAVSGVREEELKALSPPQAPDELGRLGRYRVLRVLGAGGMGIVFEAEDIDLKRPVALKIMKKSQAANEENRLRFIREARATAAIEHDHIVTIYQVSEDRGVPFLAMKLLVGESLEDRLNREGKLPLDEIIRIGQEIALGLAEAHEKGLIHRDIKPANVWLEEGRGRVKIVDFGLARARDDDARLTQENYMVGTPMYMAPEQAEGDREVDARSDLFSLGSVLYRMCTGELPFKGRNTLQVLNSLATRVPRPPDELNPELPAELSALVMNLLQKDPDRRPKNARVVVAALEEIREAPAGYEEVEEEVEELEVADEEVAQAEPKRPRRPRPARRGGRREEDPEERERRLARRVIWLGVVAVVVVLGLLGALVVQNYMKKRRQEEHRSAAPAAQTVSGGERRDVGPPVRGGKFPTSPATLSPGASLRAGRSRRG